jgi:tyrosyl-tRNA synthetase
MYPLMQAYDSIAINADIELGGTDQTFNILMGRTLQKSMDKEQQIAIFMPILEGLDGKEKMSKSLGNYIGVNEPETVMFKKCMEIPDALIVRFFELATDEHPDRIDEIRKELAEGRNPRDIKIELARTITGLYHTKEDTLNAENFYNIAFGKKAIPDDIPDMDILEACTLSDVIPLLVKNGFITSSSECRRLIQQGGMQKNGEKVDDLSCPICDRDVLKIGKKKFVRIKK